MFAENVIEPAQTKFFVTIVLVPKKDECLRFCVDDQTLSSVTVKALYPTSGVDDGRDSLGKVTLFSTLDANSGY